jgi:hypothetical protein
MQIQHMVLMLLFFLPQQNNVRKEMTPKENIIERSFHTYYDYTLRWGNKQCMRSLPDTFTVNGLNNPYFWYENYFYILLKVNTKQGHSLLRVLPLTDTVQQVRSFDDPIVFNAQTNLLACVQGSNKIKFIDLAHGKTSILKIPLPRGSKDIISSLVSATLNKNELRINWKDTAPTVFKTYRIPELK